MVCPHAGYSSATSRSKAQRAPWEARHKGCTAWSSSKKRAGGTSPQTWGDEGLRGLREGRGGFLLWDQGSWIRQWRWCTTS